MAYIKPKMNVFFANGGKAITAVIDKIAFRKYWAKPYKDSKTGKMVKKQKSMPFAVCRVILSLRSIGKCERDIPYCWLSA